MESSKDRSNHCPQLGADDVRIIVVGSSGAGKSTFARQLGLRINRTHFELDELHWGPDWTPNEDFPQRVADAALAHSWITDGGYSVVRKILWPRATTVIWLDYSFPIVLWRSLRRAIRRSWTQEAMWAGNRESWRKLVSRDSIVLFMLKTFYPKRRAMPPCGLRINFRSCAGFISSTRRRQNDSCVRWQSAHPAIRIQTRQQSLPTMCAAFTKPMKNGRFDESG